MIVGLKSIRKTLTLTYSSEIWLPTMPLIINLFKLFAQPFYNSAIIYKVKSARIVLSKQVA